MATNLTRVYNVVEALDLKVMFDREYVTLTSKDGKKQICSCINPGLEEGSGRLLEAVATLLTTDPEEEK